MEKENSGHAAFFNSAPALPPPKLPCLSGAKEESAKKGWTIDCLLQVMDGQLKLAKTLHPPFSY